MKREAVAYCTRSGRGTRLIPDTTLRGVHFITTPEYVQVTVPEVNWTTVQPSPSFIPFLLPQLIWSFFATVGGLVYGNSSGAGQQHHEWTSFISDKDFCFRACIGARSTALQPRVRSHGLLLSDLHSIYIPKSVTYYISFPQNIPMGICFRVQRSTRGVKQIGR